MKRFSTIVMALALVLSLSQCKKNEQNNAENQGEAVTITLDVSGASTSTTTDGSRVVVNPNTGTVDFENNDQIIVASGGKYVGTLTYNGSLFTGAISNATEGYPLQFYFLGNVTPAETLTSGVTQSCSVVISDQTQHLPVISAAPSNENYAASTTDYTAHLLNKCALVKFNVTTSSDAATCITGMKNKVTVDFGEPSFSYSKTGGGYINLGTGNGEKWAILLPQEAVEFGEMGSAYSEDGVYTGTRGAVPVITENGYLTTGISVMVNTIAGSVIPEGAISGMFTINSNGDQVYFSQGNLQYQASTNTWRFAENQWNYVGGIVYETQYGNVVGSDNTYISENYDGWIDLFGWGTSNINHGANCYQPWSISRIYSEYYAYGIWNANLYDQTGQADWGYNVISNGGNDENYWRTLTFEEWNYIFNYRSGSHYAKANVNGVNGILLLPDGWNSSNYLLHDIDAQGAPFSCNVISYDDWIGVFEVNGAVFLPAAGIRFGTTVMNFESCGNYWSASCYNSSHAYYVDFDEGALSTIGVAGRDYGCSVRLVCDVIE